MPDQASNGEAVRHGPTTQTEAAVEQIRSRILDMTLTPGSRIDEALLLRDFKLGRTPAREAINRLAAEKLVLMTPNRGGTYVRPLDLKEVGDIVMAHQVNEGVLGQLCRLEDDGLADDMAAIQVQYATAVAQRAYLRLTAVNEQFHLRLSQTLQNSFIFDFAQSTHRHLRRLLVHLYTLEAAEPEVQERRFAENVEQHDRIVETVRAKDRQTLTPLLEAHARTTQERLLHILDNKRVGPFLVHVSEFAPPDSDGPEPQCSADHAAPRKNHRRPTR